VLHAFQGVVNSYRHHPRLSGTLAHFWGLHIFASDGLDAKSAFIAELTWFVTARSAYANRAAEQPVYDPAAGHTQQDTHMVEVGPPFPSWSWAAKMAADMSEHGTKLDHKERDGRDPFDGSATLIHADDIVISFTRASAGGNGGTVSVQEYVRQPDSYLCFQPSFLMTAWSTRGRVRAGVPLDRHEPVQGLCLEGGYEELDLDYCAEGSVLVVFLGAWTGTQEEEDEDDYEEDGYGKGFDDFYCLLCKEVAPGMAQRIGLWSVGVKRDCGDGGTRGMLDRLMTNRVIEVEEPWERRDVRLV
jgi:hypothetical protein